MITAPSKKSHAPFVGIFLSSDVAQSMAQVAGPAARAGEAADPRGGLALAGDFSFFFESGLKQKPLGLRRF